MMKRCEILPAGRRSMTSWVNYTHVNVYQLTRAAIHCYLSMMMREGEKASTLGSPDAGRAFGRRKRPAGDVREISVRETEWKSLEFCGQSIACSEEQPGFPLVKPTT